MSTQVDAGEGSCSMGVPVRRVVRLQNSSGDILAQRSAEYGTAPESVPVSLGSRERQRERNREEKRLVERPEVRKGVEKRIAAAKLRSVKEGCRPVHLGNQVPGFGAELPYEGRHVGLWTPASFHEGARGAISA